MPIWSLITGRVKKVVSEIGPVLRTTRSNYAQAGAGFRPHFFKGRGNQMRCWIVLCGAGDGIVAVV